MRGDILKAFDRVAVRAGVEEHLAGRESRRAAGNVLQKVLREIVRAEIASDEVLDVGERGQPHVDFHAPELIQVAELLRPGHAQSAQQQQMPPERAFLPQRRGGEHQPGEGLLPGRELAGGREEDIAVVRHPPAVHRPSRTDFRQRLECDGMVRREVQRIDGVQSDLTKGRRISDGS